MESQQFHKQEKFNFREDKRQQNLPLSFSQNKTKKTVAASNSHMNQTKTKPNPPPSLLPKKEAKKIWKTDGGEPENTNPETEEEEEEDNKEKGKEPPSKTATITAEALTIMNIYTLLFHFSSSCVAPALLPSSSLPS